MSVPPDRMAPRTGGQMKDPNKIMGVNKKVFWVIMALGLVLAYYIWRRSGSKKDDLQEANAGTEVETNGVTAADIGGTPADNSFATNTDLTAIEEQIQSLQNSLFQLQQSNGGNGAGLPGEKTVSPGGGITGQPISFPFPGVNSGGLGDPSGHPIITPVVPPDGTQNPGPITTEPIHWFGPGGSGVYTPPPITTSPQTSSGTMQPPNMTPLYGHVGAPGTFAAS